MTLYTDIPSRAEIDALWDAVFPMSVSLYVPTEPASSGEAERIAFKNLARAALDQLAGADKNDLAAVEEALADLGEDDEFWRRQARTLAVFANPAWLRTFRLPNRLMALAVGGERLYVKPLMRAVTFPPANRVRARARTGRGAAAGDRSGCAARARARPGHAQRRGQCGRQGVDQGSRADTAAAG
jgi:hypothetical protein